MDKRTYLIPRAVEAANRAVELAPQSASAHLVLVMAYYFTCDAKKMHVEAEQILAINPNGPGALGVMGVYFANLGEWEFGRQLAEKGLALAGPAAPRWWWWASAEDHYRKGEYGEALEVFRRSYTESNWLDHLHIVYTLPYLGRTDEARAQIPALLKLNPKISLREADGFHKMFCFDADYRERVVTALRLAGLLEEGDESPAPQADVGAPSSHP